MVWKVPEYSIEKLNKEPFEAKCIEFCGWYAGMKPGEVSKSFGFDLFGSDTTAGNEYYVAQTTMKGYAVIHGVLGTEIEVKTRFTAGDCYVSTYVVEHTGEGYRVLASGFADSEIEHERYRTFLDEGKPLKEWVTDPDTWSPYVKEVRGKVLDGCFRVTIGSKVYETMRITVADYSNEKCPFVTERYLDVNGRTVLMRCFDSGDWYKKRAQDKYGVQIPKEEFWLIDGEAFFHSRDIFTSYIL